MAQNAINNTIVNANFTVPSGTITAGTGLTVSAGGATITGNSTINGGTVGIGTDNAANAITIGTGTVARNINIGLSAASHVITIGTTNGTASLGLNAGTGDMTLISADALTLDASGLLELNSTGGAISIGNDANANAINIGTGAAARTITIGNNTGATAVNVDIGTGDFTLDSATGNIITALDTGEITKPLQPAFLAFLSATDSNVTGDGTTFTIGTGNVFTEVFDQNSDFNTNGTFTAPVTGKYQFNMTILITDVVATMQPLIQLVTSNRGYILGNDGTAFTGNMEMSFSVLADMDAADTATFTVQVSNGTKIVDVFGGRTTFSAHLAC